MNSRQHMFLKTSIQKKHTAGFTLVEMLIAMVVSTVLIGAIYSSYQIQEKASTVQREMARMENCTRAALYLIKSDLRNSGRNGEMTATFTDPATGAKVTGVQSSRRWNQFNPNALDQTADGFQGLTLYTAMDDQSDDGTVVPDGKADINTPGAIRMIQYRLIDTAGDGHRRLYRFDSLAPATVSDPVLGAGWTLVCDCVEDIGFAFAIDNNNDEELDRIVPGGNIIWAADVNNDGKLDTNLDNNNTGSIDKNDDGDGSGTIDPVDGALAAQVPMVKAREARIWILARSLRPYSDYVDTHTYQVGYKTFTPDNTNNMFRRILVSDAVSLRNRERLAIQ